MVEGVLKIEFRQAQKRTILDSIEYRCCVYWHFFFLLLSIYEPENQSFQEETVLFATKKQNVKSSKNAKNVNFSILELKYFFQAKWKRSRAEHFAQLSWKLFSSSYGRSQLGSDSSLLCNMIMDNFRMLPNLTCLTFHNPTVQIFTNVCTTEECKGATVGQSQKSWRRMVLEAKPVCQFPPLDNIFMGENPPPFWMISVHSI